MEPRRFGKRLAMALLALTALFALLGLTEGLMDDAPATPGRSTSPSRGPGAQTSLEATGRHAAARGPSGTIRGVLRAVGRAPIAVRLEPGKRAVLSALVAGRVARVLCQDRFGGGADLLALDALPHEVAVEEARAWLAARRLLAGMEAPTPLAAMDRTLDVVSARRRAREAEEALAACRVQAPYAGRIVRRLVREGDWVAAGQPVLEIVQDGALRGYATLPAASTPPVVGATLPLWVDGEDRPRAARIASVTPRATGGHDFTLLAPDPAVCAGHRKSTSAGIPSRDASTPIRLSGDSPSDLPSDSQARRAEALAKR